jgi:hypothetical protein
VPGKQSASDVLRSEGDPNGILFVLFIPSKDSVGNDLPKGQDQEMWADAAGDLLATLFGGATEMPAAKGKWYNARTKKVITEEVILVHSYARRGDAEDEAKLFELAKFLHRMGKKLNQEEVGVVIDDVFHRIRKFPLAEG